MWSPERDDSENSFSGDLEQRGTSPFFCVSCEKSSDCGLLICFFLREDLNFRVESIIL